MQDGIVPRTWEGIKSEIKNWFDIAEDYFQRTYESGPTHQKDYATIKDNFFTGKIDSSTALNALGKLSPATAKRNKEAALLPAWEKLRASNFSPEEREKYGKLVAESDAPLIDVIQGGVDLAVVLKTGGVAFGMLGKIPLVGKILANPLTYIGTQYGLELAGGVDPEEAGKHLVQNTVLTEALYLPSQIGELKAIGLLGKKPSLKIDVNMGNSQTVEQIKNLSNKGTLTQTEENILRAVKGKKGKFEIEIPMPNKDIDLMKRYTDRVDWNKVSTYDDYANQIKSRKSIQDVLNKKRTSGKSLDEFLDPLLKEMWKTPEVQNRLLVKNAPLEKKYVIPDDWKIQEAKQDAGLRAQQARGKLSGSVSTLQDMTLQVDPSRNLTKKIYDPWINANRNRLQNTDDDLVQIRQVYQKLGNDWAVKQDKFGYTPVQRIKIAEHLNNTYSGEGKASDRTLLMVAGTQKGKLTDKIVNSYDLFLRDKLGNPIGKNPNCTLTPVEQEIANLEINYYNSKSQQALNAYAVYTGHEPKKAIPNYVPRDHEKGKGLVSNDWENMLAKIYAKEGMPTGRFQEREVAPLAPLYVDSLNSIEKQAVNINRVIHMAQPYKQAMLELNKMEPILTEKYGNKMVQILKGKITQAYLEPPKSMEALGNDIFDKGITTLIGKTYPYQLFGKITPYLNQKASIYPLAGEVGWKYAFDGLALTKDKKAVEWALKDSMLRTAVSDVELENFLSFKAQGKGTLNEKLSNNFKDIANFGMKHIIGEDRKMRVAAYLAGAEKYKTINPKATELEIRNYAVEVSQRSNAFTQRGMRSGFQQSTVGRMFNMYQTQLLRQYNNTVTAWSQYRAGTIGIDKLGSKIFYNNIMPAVHSAIVDYMFGPGLTAAYKEGFNSEDSKKAMAQSVFFNETQLIPLLSQAVSYARFGNIAAEGLTKDVAKNMADYWKLIGDQLEDKPIKIPNMTRGRTLKPLKYPVNETEKLLKPLINSVEIIAAKEGLNFKFGKNIYEMITRYLETGQIDLRNLAKSQKALDVKEETFKLKNLPRHRKTSYREPSDKPIGESRIV